MRVSLLMTLIILFLGCQQRPSVSLVVHEKIMDDVILIKVTLDKNDSPLDLRYSFKGLKSPELFGPITPGSCAKILILEDFLDNFEVKLSIEYPNEKQSTYDLNKESSSSITNASLNTAFKFKIPPELTIDMRSKDGSYCGVGSTYSRTPSHQDVKSGPKEIYQREWNGLDDNDNIEIAQFISFELLDHVE